VFLFESLADVIGVFNSWAHSYSDPRLSLLLQTDEPMNLRWGDDFCLMIIEDPDLSL